MRPEPPTAGEAALVLGCVAVLAWGASTGVGELAPVLWPAPVAVLGYIAWSRWLGR